MKTIQLTEEDKTRCEKFAEDVFGTNQAAYRRRGQSSPKAIKHQIVVGKLAELAVHRLLTGSTEPDFTILKARKKSFDADITYNELKVHVKGQTQESATRYGVSWVFSYSTTASGMDPLIVKQTDEDVCAFVVIDYDNLKADIHTIIKAKDIVNLMALPKLRNLWHSKRVIYGDDIQNKKDLCLIEKLLQPS